MSAYLIADVDITDPAGFADYSRQVPASLEPYGGRYLIRGGAAAVLEGDWLPKRCVVIEFPDMQRLKAWWESPAYRVLRVLRERTATSKITAIEGV